MCTPYEEVLRLTKEEEWNDAIQLATENNLKTDSIYKTRWFSVVLQTNNESSQLNSLFSNVLNHITDRTWVHHICKTHTCQTLDGTMSILQYAINDNNKTNNNKSNKQGNHKQDDHKQSNYENGNSSNGGDVNGGDVNDGDEFFAVRQQRHVKMYAAILKDRYDLSKTKASHLSSSGNDLRTISDIVSSIDQTTTTTKQPNINQNYRHCDEHRPSSRLN